MPRVNCTHGCRRFSCTPLPALLSRWRAAQIETVHVRQRIRIAQATSDGHKVALEDMRLRGAGEIFGQRQSGPAEMGLGSLLAITNLVTDEETIDAARMAAARLVERHGFDGLPAPMRAALSAYRMSSLLMLKLADIDLHL